MSEDGFKLPRSSYEELTKIIRAYGHLDAPGTLEDVSKLTAMNTTMVSANAGFLLAVEVIEPGSKKLATKKGRDLAQALEHEMPAEIRRCWRKVISESDFLSRLLSAIKIRKGMDDATLQSHIAYSAGAPKKPQVMTGARTVVDILRAAELIRESEGKYSVVEDMESPGNETDRAIESTGAQTKTSDETKQIVQVAHEAAHLIQAGAVGVHVQIQLRIECSTKELDGLGPKIRAVIDGIGSNPAHTPASGEE